MTPEEQAKLCSEVYRQVRGLSKTAADPENPVNPGRVPDTNTSIVPASLAKNTEALKKGILYGGAGGAALGGLYTLLSKNITASRAIRNILIGGLGGAGAGAAISSIPAQLGEVSNSMSADKEATKKLDSEKPGMVSQAMRAYGDAVPWWAKLGIGTGLTVQAVRDTNETLPANNAYTRVVNEAEESHKKIKTDKDEHTKRLADTRNKLEQLYADRVTIQQKLHDLQNSAKVKPGQIADAEGKQRRLLVEERQLRRTRRNSTKELADLNAKLPAVALLDAKTQKVFGNVTKEQAELLKRLSRGRRASLQAQRWGANIFRSPTTKLPAAGMALLSAVPSIWNAFASKSPE